MGRTCLELGSTELQTVVGIPAGFGGTVGLTCWLARPGRRGWQWEAGDRLCLASTGLGPIVTPPLALPCVSSL